MYDFKYITKFRFFSFRDEMMYWHSRHPNATIEDFEKEFRNRNNISPQHCKLIDTYVKSFEVNRNNNPYNP